MFRLFKIQLFQFDLQIFSVKINKGIQCNKVPWNKILYIHTVYESAYFSSPFHRALFLKGQRELLKLLIYVRNNE